MPAKALENASLPYPKFSNVIYIPWNVQYPRFWNFFGKNLRYALSRKFDYEPVLKRNYAKNMRGFKRKGLRLISCFFPKEFFNPDLFSKVEEFFLPVSKEFRRLCSVYRPSMVVTSSPGFNPYDAEAITLAKKYKLPSVAVNFSWDNFHNGAHNIRKPDFLIVWNGIMKNEAIEMHGYKPERVFVSGPIRFDHYFRDKAAISRSEFLISKGLNPQEKTLLISTVTNGNYPLECELIESIIEEREKNELGCFPNIFIRLHPKDSYEKYKKFENYKNIHIEEAGKRQKVDLGSSIELDEQDLTNLHLTLLYSDVVINYASTITLEAFIFDKPVVNIGFPHKYLDAYDFTHYRSIVAKEAVKLARNLNELVQYVRKYLDYPEIDRNERSLIRSEFVPFTDGLSYKRNVDFLDEIIR